MTLKRKKQLLGIDLSIIEHFDASSLAASRIRIQNVQVLNVAGPMAQTNCYIGLNNLVSCLGRKNEEDKYKIHYYQSHNRTQVLWSVIDMEIISAFH